MFSLGACGRIKTPRSVAMHTGTAMASDPAGKERAETVNKSTYPATSNRVALFRCDTEKHR
jgi:hypothetical protein